MTKGMKIRKCLEKLYWAGINSSGRTPEKDLNSALKQLAGVVRGEKKELDIGDYPVEMMSDEFAQQIQKDNEDIKIYNQAIEHIAKMMEEGK